MSKSVKNLESINKELESTKQQSAQMKKQIGILEEEKEILKRRMTTLESYINDGSMNAQLQIFLEDIKKRIEGTY